MSKFKQLQSTAKELGINTFGMSTEKIEAAIKAVTGNNISEALEGENVAPPKTEEIKVETEKAKPGRPIESNSARQQRLAEMEKRRIENGGTIKLGRPVESNSARQQRLAEMEKRRIENGGVVKRGRKPNPDSPNYKKQMERLAKIEAGVELKPGRPKMIKVEVPVNVETNVETNVEANTEVTV